MEGKYKMDKEKNEQIENTEAVLSNYKHKFKRRLKQVTEKLFSPFTKVFDTVESDFAGSSCLKKNLNCDAPIACVDLRLACGSDLFIYLFFRI